MLPSPPVSGELEQIQLGDHSQRPVAVRDHQRRGAAEQQLECVIDVLDRVLDKGIVVDAWVRVSLVGIDLITVEARIVVASIDTYLRYAEAMGITAPVARPPALVSPREELTSGEAVERIPPERAV